MDTSTIREQLHQYIEKADDKKVSGLFMLIEDNIRNIEDFSLSKEQISILQKERKKHLAGESKSYSWEEAKNIIRGTKNH